MSDVYFFGCIARDGHYLYQPPTDQRRGLVPTWKTPPDWPWHGTGVLDGEFAPEDKNQRLGRAKLTHHQGWTVLAMWDRSVDSRFNSNAAFVARGTHDFAAVMALAREHFPRVLARIEAQAPLVEVTS